MDEPAVDHSESDAKEKKIRIEQKKALLEVAKIDELKVKSKGKKRE